MLTPSFFFFFCVSSNAKLAAAKWIKGIDSDNDDVDQQGGHAAPDFIVANVIIVAPPVRVTKLARIKCDRLSFLIEPRNRQKIAQTSQQILDSNLPKKKNQKAKKTCWDTQYLFSYYNFKRENMD